MSWLLAADPSVDRVATLTWFMIILGAVIFVGVTALLLTAALRRRGTLLEHAPVDAHADHRWIHWGGVTMPSVVLIALFIMTLFALRAYPYESAVQPDAVIDVVGHRWWWDVTYTGPTLDQQVHTANEIHVPVNRAVEIRLSTKDVIHSFWVPQLHGKMDLIPGRVNVIRIRAERPGTYLGECAEFCGQQHAHMRFVVIAESEQAFQQWLAQQRKPAVAPTDSVTALGAAAFQQHACMFCHTIRGTDAGGRVAPDLTHVGSRRFIAAGTLPNSPGNLEAWILDAPQLKPGTQMPAFTDFTGPQARALARYLSTLQ